MKGIYQHCAKHHLHRYTGEFALRYSNWIATGATGEMRADRALQGIV